MASDHLTYLLTIPQGISFSQENAIGSTIDGGMMESLDTVPMSMASSKRYFSQGKVNESLVEEYARLREQRSASYAQNKPSPAQVEAVKASFQDTYDF